MPKDTVLTVCFIIIIMIVQMSFTGEKRVGHTVCVPPLMSAANHSTRMEKCQNAISSSSERDKCTLLSDTPCTESPAHEERDVNRYRILSLRPVNEETKRDLMLWVYSLWDSNRYDHDLSLQSVRKEALINTAFRVFFQQNNNNYSTSWQTHLQQG